MALWVNKTVEDLCPSKIESQREGFDRSLKNYNNCKKEMWCMWSMGIYSKMINLGWPFELANLAKMWKSSNEIAVNTMHHLNKARREYHQNKPISITSNIFLRSNLAN